MLNVLTTRGYYFLNKAIENGTDLKVSSATIGIGHVKDINEGLKLTSIKSKVFEVPIADVTTDETGVTTITIETTNETLTTKVNLTEIGLYIRISPTLEVMFWYSDLGENPVILESRDNGVSTTSIEVKLNFSASLVELLKYKAPSTGDGSTGGEVVEGGATVEYVDNSISSAKVSLNKTITTNKNSIETKLNNEVKTLNESITNTKTTLEESISNIEPGTGGSVEPYSSTTITAGTYENFELEFDTYFCDCTDGNIIITSIADDVELGVESTFEKIDGSENKVILKNKLNGGFVEAPYSIDDEILEQFGSLTYMNV